MKKGGNQQSAISGQPNNPTTQQPNNPTVFTLFVTYVLPHALSGLRFACPAFASHLNSGFPKPLASMEAASQSYQLPPVADLLRQSTAPLPSVLVHPSSFTIHPFPFPLTHSP